MVQNQNSAKTSVRAQPEEYSGGRLTGMGPILGDPAYEKGRSERQLTLGGRRPYVLAAHEQTAEFALDLPKPALPFYTGLPLVAADG